MIYLTAIIGFCLCSVAKANISTTTSRFNLSHSETIFKFLDRNGDGIVNQTEVDFIQSNSHNKSHSVDLNLIGGENGQMNLTQFENRVKEATQNDNLTLPSSIFQNIKCNMYRCGKVLVENLSKMDMQHLIKRNEETSEIIERKKSNQIIQRKKKQIPYEAIEKDFIAASFVTTGLGILTFLFSVVMFILAHIGSTTSPEIPFPWHISPTTFYGGAQTFLITGSVFLFITIIFQILGRIKPKKH